MIERKDTKFPILLRNNTIKLQPKKMQIRKTEDKVRCYSKNNTSVSEHRYRIKSQSQAYLNNRSQIRKKIKYTQTPTLLKVHHDLLIPKHKLKIGEELDEEKKENCNEMFDHYQEEKQLKNSNENQEQILNKKVFLQRKKAQQAKTPIFKKYKRNLLPIIERGNIFNQSKLFIPILQSNKVWKQTDRKRSLSSQKIMMIDAQKGEYIVFENNENKLQSIFDQLKYQKYSFNNFSLAIEDNVFIVIFCDYSQENEIQWVHEMFFWSAMPIKKDSKIFTIDLAMYFLKKIFKKLNKDIVFETDQPSLKFVNIHGKSKFIKFNLLKLIEWKSQE